MADGSSIVFPGNRYQVLSKLGSGAFGDVYKAKDLILNRTVAVKRIRMDAFADSAQLEEAKQRFLREAQVAAQLKHPNIVTIHDIVSTDEMSFIVMEFIEGTTLQSVLSSRKRLSLKETIDLISQAADALDHAHQAKVVHRDIKPANIMIEPGGRAKVTDFGIAKAESTANLTATGSILGTPNYMSPEQARGDKVDGRSDLFSLSCIAYECLAGQKPFRGESLTSVLMKILSEEPPPLDCAGAGLPLEVAGILKRALAKSPSERFATGRELVEALRKAGEHAPLPPAEQTWGGETLSSAVPVPPTRQEPSSEKTKSVPPPPPPIPQAARSVTIRKPPPTVEARSSGAAVKIAVAVVMIAVAAAVGIYVWKKPEPPPTRPTTTSVAVVAEVTSTAPVTIPAVTTSAVVVSQVTTTATPATSVPVLQRDTTTVPPRPPQEVPRVKQDSVTVPPNEPISEPTDPTLPRSSGGRIQGKSGIYGNREFRSRADSPVVRANEAAAVFRLKTLVNVQNRFRASQGRFGTADELAAFVENTRRTEADLVRQPLYRGYRFQLRVDSKDFYSATATPAEYGVSGVHSLYVDATGRIRGSNRYGEPADASDPEIR